MTPQKPPEPQLTESYMETWIRTRAFVASKSSIIPEGVKSNFDIAVPNSSRSPKVVIDS